MMDRLRDRMSDPDAVIARAARLVASAPILDDSEMVKRRVLARMELRRTGPSRWPVLLRPAPALTIVLIAGAALAGATVGREPILDAYHRLTGTASSPADTPAATVRPGSTRAPATPPAPIVVPLPEVAPEAPALPPAPARAAAPAVPTRPTAGAASVRRNVRPAPPQPQAASPELAAAEPATAPATAAAPEPGPAAPRTPSTVESTLVAGAARALRVEHDPARAGTLLDEYLRRFPDGVLVEEALALAVQAATARGDSRAHELAQTYLQRYPQGRFARQARATAGKP